MGQDKAQLRWKEGTLLTHAVDRLAQVCPSVWICTSHPPADPSLTRASGYLPDAAEDAGPLGGIVAALESSSTEWNLLLAVDLPLVPVAVLAALAAQAEAARHACVLAVGNGRPQPLCGLYHRRLAAGLRVCLEQGTLKVMQALEQAGGSPGLFQPMAGDTAAAGWWRNLNTREDWQAAQQLAAKGPKEDDSAAAAHRLS